MDYLQKHPLPSLVRFVLFDGHAYDEFAAALDHLRQHPQPPPLQPGEQPIHDPQPLDEPHPLDGMWDDDESEEDDSSDERRLW